MADAGYKKKAYEYIKKKILNGSLLPGDVLSEKELTGELGISRTPVREAIQRLAEEQLLVVMPSRGTIVSHISVDEIRQLYEARKLNEPFVVRQAVKRADREQLLNFRKIFAEQTQMQLAEQDWDQAFHLYLAECAGNRFLKKLIKDLMTQSVRIRALSNEKKENRLEQAREEHLAIIDAMLAGDEEGAQQAVLTHLLRSEEGYKEIYPNQNWFSL